VSHVSGQEVATAPPPSDQERPERLTTSSSKGRILRGSAWLLVAKVLTTVLGLLINASLARLLSPADLGAFFSVFTLVIIGSTVAQLGLDRVVVRLVSASLAVGRPGDARHVIRTVFVIGGVAAVVLGAALALGLGSLLATHLYHSSVMAGVMPIAAGWLVATALQSLLYETFRGMQRFGLAAVFDALFIDIIVATTVTTLWFVHARLSLNQVAALFGSATAATVLVAGFILWGRTRRMRGEGHADSREIVSIAWPLLITNVATYLLGTGVDLWVVGAFRPQEVVAVYGAASRLMFLVVTPFLVLQGVVAPLVGEMAAQGRNRDLEKTLRAIATLAEIPAVVALIVFIAFGSSVMGFFYGPFYRQGAIILFILSVGRLAVVWTGSCAIVLMMTGHQRVLMNVTVAFGTMSVLAGVALAWQFGAVGVAFATATAAVLQNVFTMITVKRRVGVWTNAYLSPRPLIDFLKERAPASQRSE
jgi:O-antigen/teichoic acid export membrane protein